jgi:hypothetical protein
MGCFVRPYIGHLVCSRSLCLVLVYAFVQCSLLLKLSADDKSTLRLIGPERKRSCVLLSVFLNLNEGIDGKEPARVKERRQIISLTFDVSIRTTAPYTLEHARCNGPLASSRPFIVAQPKSRCASPSERSIAASVEDEGSRSVDLRGERAYSNDVQKSIRGRFASRSARSGAVRSMYCRRRRLSSRVMSIVPRRAGAMPSPLPSRPLV